MFYLPLVWEVQDDTRLFPSPKSDSPNTSWGDHRVPKASSNDPIVERLASSSTGYVNSGSQRGLRSTLGGNVPTCFNKVLLSLVAGEEQAKSPELLILFGLSTFVSILHFWESLEGLSMLGYFGSPWKALGQFAVGSQ